MKIVYLFNAIYGVGGPNDVTTKIHGLDFLENSWKPMLPKFNPAIQPLDNEAVIPKSHKDGFNGTVLDYYLKTWNIDTLITVGFHLKSCLFHTCVGARHHNYRLFPTGWVETSFTKQSKGWSDYSAYGYLWWLGSLDGINYAFASGYGGQYLYVAPALKSVIVLTANSDKAIAEMKATTNPVIKDPAFVLRRFLFESRWPPQHSNTC